MSYMIDTVTLVPRLQVPILVPRPRDALVLDPISSYILIFSKIVHVYVLLGDVLHD